ncbi:MULTISPECIES: hypothetical protein [unclassified Streptomyces]|uniref:hypothetical protein n=1 Tax=unclassified Streptomyces TaxID=2593676 RepID=UPI000CD5BEB5|nr:MULTISPECIES: hypothetical protein [unclassified Streptomyces]
MQELRFDDIRFTTAIGSDQTWLRRALGGHELSVQLAVEVSPFAEAGKILALEAELFGFGSTPAQRSRLGRVTANLAYTPARRPDLTLVIPATTGSSVAPPISVPPDPPGLGWATSRSPTTTRTTRTRTTSPPTRRGRRGPYDH